MPDLFIQSLLEKATFARLQELFEINPKSWKDLTDKGIFKDCITYGEVLKALFIYFKQNKEAKELTAQAKLVEQENHPRFKNTEVREQLDQILVVEKLQKIKLDKAREEELWLKNATTRNELLQRKEVEPLVYPIIINIVNILRHAAIVTPDLQEPVDKCMKEFYRLGEQLEEIALVDKERYVQNILDTELDCGLIIDNYTSSLQISQ